MAKRRTEVVAASCLRTWTDSDTAMQIVGASLGVFGEGSLDPTVVLASETPLRNALFDALLSLVEGGALEIRATDDHHYAFRWRDDVGVAGLSPDSAASIDLAVPSPYLAELEQTRAERDEALRRADVAEAVAAERERLLRLADVRTAAPRKPVTKRAPKKPEPEKAPPRSPAHVDAPAAQQTEASEVERQETSEVLYLTPADAETATAADLTAEEHASTADVVEPAPRPKWSGYAIDRARNHLASVDRLVDEG
jgi:hypothetical protein